MRKAELTPQGRFAWVALAIAFAVAGALLIVQPFSGDDAPSDEPPPTRLEAKAEGIEAQLGESPNDAELLRTAMLAWIEAGSDRISRSRTQGTPPGFPAVARDYRVGLESWRGFLRQTGGEANTQLAETAGHAYMRLAEIGSRDLSQLEADLAGSVTALRIASKHTHKLFTLSDLAILEYFNGEFGGGEKMAHTSMAEVPDATLKAVEMQFVEYRERAEVFRGLLRQARRELRRTGSELLAKPLKVFRSSGDLNQDDPTF